jgi:hypothetical protein
MSTIPKATRTYRLPMDKPEIMYCKRFDIDRASSFSERASS